MKKWLIPILISIIIGSILLAFNIRNNYKYVEVDDYTRQMNINYLNAQVKNNHYNVSRQEIRTMLEEELDFYDYTYKEGDYRVGGYAGKFSRIIEIDKDLKIEQYCILLCHEMCHIKYEVDNERKTQFLTFKTLYESDNDTLKRVGTWFGIYVLDRCYDHEYDCSQLIVDYLVDNVEVE